MSASENKSPSLLGVIFFAIQIALFSGLFGFVVLASVSPKPFKSVAEHERYLKKHPDEPIPSAHYLVGRTSSKREWRLKREVLLIGNDTSLEIIDGEINAWLSEKFKLSRVSLSKKEEQKFYLVPEVLNVFIDPIQGIHFSLPVKMVFFGKSINCTLIGEGQFIGNNPAAFQLSSLRINGARIPFAEKTPARLLSALLKSFYENEEFSLLKEAWGKVDSLEIIENGIRLDIN